MTIIEYFDKENIQYASGENLPLAEIWREVNQIRVVGPAPIIDMVKIMKNIDLNFDFSVPPNKQNASIYLDAFDMFLLPMLDGIFKEAAQNISQRLLQILNIVDSEELKNRVEQRLNSISV